MKQYYLSGLCVFFLLSTSSQDSLNMTQIGSWDLEGDSYSEIWGYNSGGNEYAIMGSYYKVHFINVTNPANPVQAAEYTVATGSTWKDIKTYSNYAYVVSEAALGLLIFDLSGLTSNNVTLLAEIKTDFTSAHNIYIEGGKLYVIGSNTQYYGVIIYDLAGNPTNPTLLASLNLGSFGGPANSYVHDIHVVGDIGYCSHGNDQSLYIYDFATPSAPVYQGHISNYLEGGYNHSSWLDATGSYLIFTDETFGKGVKMMDVSNPANLNVSANDIFRSDLLNLGTSIAHNAFVLGNYVYISYYHDGVQVFDISTPGNVTNVAYYDTYPDNTDYSEFHGCWGVYPYLPSGNIIASDMTYGLKVLQLSGPLPVELTAFSGQVINDEIKLDWQTSTETNNDRFEVEKSENGYIFKKIGTVRGNGFTLEPQQYSFIDEYTVKGDNYYRLRQVDTDGTYEYSKIIKVKYLPKGPARIYPTVLSKGHSATFEISTPHYEPVTINIFNISGILVRSFKFQPVDESGSWQLPLYDLSSGMYVYQFTSGYQQGNGKILVE